MLTFVVVGLVVVVTNRRPNGRTDGYRRTRCKKVKVAALMMIHNVTEFMHERKFLPKQLVFLCELC